MPDYLDLERRFGLLTKYSVEELLALDVMGRKRLGWGQLLTGRFSIITARANFGKTMELRACAQRLRDEGKHAVFVGLHRLLEEPDFQIALEAIVVGRPSPESLDEAVAKLAAASAVCQLPNMELAADALKVRDGVLSCRPLVGCFDGVVAIERGKSRARRISGIYFF